MTRSRLLLALALLALGLTETARGDINVGVTLSATGAAASLGIPERNTFELLPTAIAGQKVNWIVLDDGSDTTKAVTNTRKLLSEDKVDVIVGSTITPNSLAMVDVVADAETPMISMAASARIVDPANPKTKWVFKTPQKDLAARNYKGKVYQTHGVANPDFLRVVGKEGNGTILPAGPMLVYEQLPASNPVKKSAAEYVTKYEAKYGTRSTFGGHAWDAYLLLAHAIPEALKKAKPGTKEFRAALRDGLENAKDIFGAHGVFNMSAQDHNGLDNRARLMIRIEDGKWVVIK